MQFAITTDPRITKWPTTDISVTISKIITKYVQILQWWNICNEAGLYFKILSLNLAVTELLFSKQSNAVKTFMT